MTDGISGDEQSCVAADCPNERIVMPCTDMTRRLRNDALLRLAYENGRRNGFDELEILKRFTLMLLDLKDEAMQEKLDELLLSPAKPIFKADA
jgi:hypothetical protein